MCPTNNHFDITITTMYATLEEGEEAPSDEAPPSILRDCNLVITRGMRIVVRGPNGAGKYEIQQGNIV